MAANPKGVAGSYTNHRAPHFFKVIVFPFDQGMMIPDAFMEKYGRDLQDIVLLKVPTGASWKVELVHSGNGTLLQKGWEEFAKYYYIKKFHFLVFRYEGNSQFHVFMFDRTALEIEYRVEANCDWTDSCIGTSGQRGSSCVRTELKISDDDEDLEEISSETWKKNFPTTRASKGKRARVEDIAEDVSNEFLDDISECKPKTRSSSRLMMENLYSTRKNAVKQADTNPYYHTKSSGNKKAEQHEVGNPVAEDVSNEFLDDISECRPKTRSSSRLMMENLYSTRKNAVKQADTNPYYHTKSSGNKKAKQHEVGNPGCSKQKLKKGESPFVTSRSLRSCVKQVKSSYEKAKALISSKPFFVSVMLPSMVSYHFELKIPMNFVRDYLSAKKKTDFMLCVSGKITSWPVRLQPSSRSGIRGRICAGWKKFVRDNCLKLGDVCVFELVPGSRKFNITIYSAPEDEMAP